MEKITNQAQILGKLLLTEKLEQPEKEKLPKRQRRKQRKIQNHHHQLKKWLDLPLTFVGIDLLTKEMLNMFN